MGLATGGAWTGSYAGASIDGVDMWSSITTASASPRTEIAHLITVTEDGSLDAAVILKDGMKYFKVARVPQFNQPDFVFAEDLSPDSSRTLCSDGANWCLPTMESKFTSTKTANDVTILSGGMSAGWSLQVFVWAGVGVAMMLAITFILQLRLALTAQVNARKLRKEVGKEDKLGSKKVLDRSVYGAI
jgi:hypothetical protein